MAGAAVRLLDGAAGGLLQEDAAPRQVPAALPAHQHYAHRARRGLQPVQLRHQVLGALLDRIKLPLPPRQVRVRVGRVRGVGGAARPGGPAQLRPAPRHQRPHHQLQHPGQARLRRQG